MRDTAVKFHVSCCGLRIPLTCPVPLQCTAGDPQTHIAEQPISLDGADGVSPGAPNANAEGGDPVGHVVAIICPRSTLASTLDHFFTVYLKDSLPGKAVRKLCEANGDFADAEVIGSGPLPI